MSGNEVTAAAVVSEEVDDLILGIDSLGRQRCRWSFAQNLIGINEKVVKLISGPRQNMLRKIYSVENSRSSRAHDQRTGDHGLDVAPPDVRRLSGRATVFGNRDFNRQDSYAR